MHLFRPAFVAATACLLAALPARASAQAADSAPPPLKGTVDLGLVAASGNTDLTTFSFGEKLEYTKGKWAVAAGGTDGVRPNQQRRDRK